MFLHIVSPMYFPPGLFQEFHNFAMLRKELQPLALAINSYGKSYGLLTKADFQRAASQVESTFDTSKEKIAIIIQIFFQVLMCVRVCPHTKTIQIHQCLHCIYANIHMHTCKCVYTHTHTHVSCAYTHWLRHNVPPN